MYRPIFSDHNREQRIDRLKNRMVHLYYAGHKEQARLTMKAMTSAIGSRSPVAVIRRAIRAGFGNV